jgi:hypothetical protein
MKKSIWTMCVVGLMVASPVVCRATTISEAVAAAGDGKYILMDQGSSITMSFAQACSGTSPAISVKLASASNGIRVEFYSGTSKLYYYDVDGYLYINFETGDTLYGPGQPSPFDQLNVGWEFETSCPQSFDSVKIIAYGVNPVYLDAVQGFVQDGGSSIDGTEDGYEGTITAFGPVLDPVAMIEGLAGKVASFNLQQGIDNSLDAKLDAALAAWEDASVNNNGAAVNKLVAFISEVEAQRDKKITNAQADTLVADAQAIITVMTQP